MNKREAGRVAKDFTRRLQKSIEEKLPNVRFKPIEGEYFFSVDAIGGTGEDDTQWAIPEPKPKLLPEGVYFSFWPAGDTVDIRWNNWEKLYLHFDLSFENAEYLLKIKREEWRKKIDDIIENFIKNHNEFEQLKEIELKSEGSNQNGLIICFTVGTIEKSQIENKSIDECIEETAENIKLAYNFFKHKDFWEAMYTNCIFKEEEAKIKRREKRMIEIKKK